MTQPLISEEEEATVTDEPAANVAPELVEAERKPGRKDWVAGIEDVIAQKIEQAAMRSVRAGLRGYVHLAAGGAAIFGGKEHGVDAELFDGVGRNRKPDEGLLRLVDDVGRVDAVIGKVVVIQPTAGKANAALVAAAGIDRARHQRRQRRPVPAVQRQLLDLFGLGAGAQHVARLVQLRVSPGDIRPAVYIPPTARLISSGCVCPTVCSRFSTTDLLETGRGTGHAVKADGQLRNVVIAACRGHGFSHQARGCLESGDAGSGNSPARAIGNGSA